MLFSLAFVLLMFVGKSVSSATVASVLSVEKMKSILRREIVRCVMLAKKQLQ
jgi:hypothetical protein